VEDDEQEEALPDGFEVDVEDNLVEVDEEDDDGFCSLDLSDPTSLVAGEIDMAELGLPEARSWGTPTSRSES
jgi:hypothetical protein